MPQGEMLRRHIAFTPVWRKRDDAGAVDDSVPSSLDIVASTDDPVDWGGFREVLVHEADNIDISAARSLLINHDPNQVAGRIQGMKSAGGSMTLGADVMPDARLASGPTVRAAIDFGALRGVSIGYGYSQADTAWDESTRTLTVRRWRLLECSLTPIPADKAAQVRSRPEWIPDPIDTPAAGPAAQHGDRHMPDPIIPAAGQPAAVPVTPNPATGAENDNVRKASEHARAAAIQEARDIASLARSHNLDPDSYLELGVAGASQKMLRDLAAVRATNLGQPVGGARSVEVTEAAEDKARDAFFGAMAHNAGFRGENLRGVQDNNSLRGRGLLDMVRGTAIALGIRSAGEWDKQDLAWLALGKPSMIQGRGARDANVTSSSFPNFVFLNAITKVVAQGFAVGGKSIRYQPLVSVDYRPDFKSFYIGTLAVQNLQKTAEDVAFPELDKSEGVFNSQVKMWGGTMSLTFQALVNDDTAQFDRNLRQAGLIAQKTIDKRVFQKLLMGTSTSEATSTWTSNTTSGGTVNYTTNDGAAASRAGLGKVRAALMNKVGLDGNPLGTIPRFAICGPTREQQLRGLLSVAPGQQTVQQADLEVISSAWLEASALIGNATDTYYLLADPNEVTGLVLSYIRGMESPQVMPYDAGAVAASKWKIFQPFEADLVNMSISGTTVIAAAQQATT
jgi:HK97 family phage prohead protease